MAYSRPKNEGRREGTPTTYRLRGHIGNEERVFDLSPGEYCLGRSPESDISLPLADVSRRHARLRVTADRLLLEDCDSRNGTFVNHQRIARAEIPPGALLSFGAARLFLEPLNDEDATLAIELSPRSSSLEVAESDPTTICTAGIFGLTLVQEILGHLELDDLSSALSRLLHYLGASGGCVAGWQGEEVFVVAAEGVVGAIDRDSQLRRLPQRLATERPARRGLPRSESLFSITDSTLSAAVRIRSRKSALGLLVWNLRHEALEAEALLRIAVTLFDGPHLPRGNPAADLPMARDLEREAETDHDTGGLVAVPELLFPEGYQPGHSPPMKSLYRQMKTLLKGPIPVLLRGETGVGKEMISRILHRSSIRREAPFLAINCAAIPAELLEAELFGVGKAVATGVEPRPGIFLSATGGTLLLDEVGEMSPALQAKLLRALQEKEIQPVGGTPCKVDVRILAATNADLGAMMDEGRFRRDLYYRLAGYTLEIPPLRHCREDISGLIEHFLESYTRESGNHPRGLSIKALRLLGNYDWPGNIRELEHEIRRLVYCSSDDQIIDSSLLSPTILSANDEAWEPDRNAAPDDESLTLAPRMRAYESQLVREALRRAGGNQSRAARWLGVSRNGLIKKMKRLGLE